MTEILKSCPAPCALTVALMAHLEGEAVQRSNHYLPHLPYNYWAYEVRILWKGMTSILSPKGNEQARFTVMSC